MAGIDLASFEVVVGIIETPAVGLDRFRSSTVLYITRSILSP